MVDVDDIIYKIVECLTFEEKICLGDKLGNVDTDFSCVLDDMYPDRIAELDTELGEALHEMIEGEE